ncbi:uncharacterized protein MELLADRAFT_58418 [Melampsora larici-populina 98AG31]|uniref:Uncharacterized protein n=1 Tax=Melampsora larici-populina (strain 98AG31 / pathotype 3-4-7) TaxID=747676 RepID=F4R3G1_MELLP|nr:uncharacterized protein MELLADRAFT_58418 [Melampsora larici-populina 98AG31]EGG12622.1 hypothetical protein MELLADRAFT_58418 [Melampsora larici-populina 98AG31]
MDFIQDLESLDGLINLRITPIENLTTDSRIGYSSLTRGQSNLLPRVSVSIDKFQIELKFGSQRYNNSTRLIEEFNNNGAHFKRNYKGSQINMSGSNLLRGSRSLNPKSDLKTCLPMYRELTPRTIINELVKRLSVDEVYFKQKEIKMLIKSTAASTLEETSGSDDESKAKEDSISVKQSSPEAQVPSESSSQTKPKSSAKGRKSTKKEKIKDTSCEPQVSESSKPKIELTASDSGESSKSESVKQKAPRKRGPKTEKKNEIKSAQFLDSDGEPVAESPPTIAPPSKAKRKSTGEDHESAPPAKQSKTKSKATKSVELYLTHSKAIFQEQIAYIPEYMLLYLIYTD